MDAQIVPKLLPLEPKLHLQATTIDKEKQKKKNGDGDLTAHFSRVEKFENILLNQIIVLWLLLQEIPWN
jgi:hypothetical protein